jgi:hypothetical protein
VPDYEGIIYASGTEPTYTADGITSRVAAVIVVDLSDPEINGAVADCAFQVDYAAEQGRPRATRCLVVQWSFDVAADFRVDEFSPEGGLSPGPFVGADGIQHDQAIVNTGLPGTVDNLISAAYPLTAGGTAGTLRFDTGSNLVGYTTHTFDVPTELAPIDLRT